MFRRVASRARKDPHSDATKDTYWTLSEPQRIAIREKLLQALGAETTLNVRNKVSDAIAEVARQHAEEGAELEHSYASLVWNETDRSTIRTRVAGVATGSF